MRLVGFAVRFGSGTEEAFPGADRVMAAQCPRSEWDGTSWFALKSGARSEVR